MVLSVGLVAGMTATEAQADTPAPEPPALPQSESGPIFLALPDGRVIPVDPGFAPASPSIGSTPGSRSVAPVTRTHGSH